MLSKCLPRTIKQQLEPKFRAIYYDFDKLVKDAFRARSREEAQRKRQEAKAEAAATLQAEQDAAMALAAVAFEDTITEV